jgi:hypothetical protein
MKHLDSDLEAGTSQGMSLKMFLTKKPMLAEKVLDKVEGIVQKLVEKGMSRHSLVQAIICDYVVSQPDSEKIKWLAETMKEKLPTLLASKQGLLVACSLFNVLDAKDRKLVVKSVQEPLKEMSTNKIAHLFLVHVLNNLDDTVISKKKIVNDLLLTIDENIADKTFQAIFLGIYAPNSKRYFTSEDLAAFEANQEQTTSKKNSDVRREELIKIVQGPLEKFFEENMSFYLRDISRNALLSKVMAQRIEQGDTKSSMLIDELFRQVQKKDEGEILIGHPDIHRMLKDFVKVEQEKADETEFQFTKKLAAQMTGDNMESCLKSRASWVFVQILENEKTASLVKKDLTANRKKINELLKSKELKANKGL